MRSSARNQFEGTVRSVRTGAVHDEIEIDANGLQLVAVVTSESRAALGLEVGAVAFALVKASSVVLVTNSEGVRFSARNQLAGRVAAVTPGAVNTEVVIELGDRGGNGGSIVAVVTNGSAGALALEVGQSATALFKASSVIVGVGA